MMGPLVNALAIVAGGLAGLIFRRFISKKISDACQYALGICILMIGIKMATQYAHVLIPILSMACGAGVGKALDLKTRIDKGATKIQRVSAQRNPGLDEASISFSAGLTTTSVLYCTGAMAILGGFNSGALANHEILYAKAALDGILSVTFAAVYGIGVIFSSIVVFGYEGGIALVSSWLPSINQNSPVLLDITSVGGVLLTMVGLRIARIHSEPVEDFLPAIPIGILLSVFWR
jgi:uncharacterized membrane protein YqgA involved in biofilm formation